MVSQKKIINFKPMFKNFKNLFNKLKEKRIDDKIQQKYISKQRIEICESCEEFKSGTRQCGVCWCFMDIKTKMKNKSCPEGKW